MLSVPARCQRRLPQRSSGCRWRAYERRRFISSRRAPAVERFDIAEIVRTRTGGACPGGMPNGVPGPQPRAPRDLCLLGLAILRSITLELLIVGGPPERVRVRPTERETRHQQIASKQVYRALRAHTFRVRSDAATDALDGRSAIKCLRQPQEGQCVRAWNVRTSPRCDR